MQAVSPDVGIYSAGVDNSYNHPHDEVIDRVLDYGVEVFGTDVHGTVIVETDGNSYQIKTDKVATITQNYRESSNKAATPTETENQEENDANRLH